MVTSLADVEYGVEIGRLAAAGQHGPYTTFQGCNLGCHGIVGGVLQTGIEIAVILQVEEAGHLFAGFIFKGCALVNGQNARFSFLGIPTGLYAERFLIHLFHCRYAVFFLLFIPYLTSCLSLFEDYGDKLTMEVHLIAAVEVFHGQPVDAVPQGAFLILTVGVGQRTPFHHEHQRLAVAQ